MHSSGWQRNGANSPAAPLREAKRARATSDNVPQRFNSISILTGSKPLHNTICLFICWLQKAPCLHSTWAECDEYKGVVEDKKKSEREIIGHGQCNAEECLKTRPLSETYDWLKKGWESFFTPTVSNLSVHSLLQFNHSSHLRGVSPLPSPPATHLPYVALGESYAYMQPHIPHMHSNSVYDMSHSLPLVWKSASAAASNAGYPLWSHWPWGFFMVRGFFYGRDPPDIWHTSGAV